MIEEIPNRLASSTAQVLDDTSKNYYTTLHVFVPFGDSQYQLMFQQKTIPSVSPTPTSRATSGVV